MEGTKGIKVRNFQNLLQNTGTPMKLNSQKQKETDFNVQIIKNDFLTKAVEINLTNCRISEQQEAEHHSEILLRPYFKVEKVGQAKGRTLPKTSN